ncbi:MAG TPA: hypothetical protein VFJ78_09855 [Gaiellaceae bacterium]|nr:hypothetical protein [Gaiellaceae bacterium]
MPRNDSALAGQWLEALAAAEAALRSAGRYLGAQDLAEHRRRFTQERIDVLRLLARLGHDRQTDSPLLGGSVAPGAISAAL